MVRRKPSTDYIYVKGRKPIKGDIVMFDNEHYQGDAFTQGKLYRVREDTHGGDSVKIESDNHESVTNGANQRSFHILETAHGDAIMEGDTITAIEYSPAGRERGRVHQCIGLSGSKVQYGSSVSAHRHKWVLLRTVNHTNNTVKKSEWEL